MDAVDASVAGRPSVVVRRATSTFVLAGSVFATVVARHDGDTLVTAWLAVALYLGCCVEPMRRVLKRARMPFGLCVALIATALLCVGVVFCLPVTNYGDGDGATASVLSLAAGDGRLSDHAQTGYADATWILAGALLIATMTLWYGVMRLARRSRWQSLDHAAGDGGFRSTVEVPDSTAPEGQGPGPRADPRRRR